MDLATDMINLIFMLMFADYNRSGQSPLAPKMSWTPSSQLKIFMYFFLPSKPQIKVKGAIILPEMHYNSPVTMRDLRKTPQNNFMLHEERQRDGEESWERRKQRERERMKRLEMRETGGERRRNKPILSMVLQSQRGNDKNDKITVTYRLLVSHQHHTDYV